MLTPGETQLHLRLQELGVAKYVELADYLHLSTKTLQRLLRKVGCYHSLNHNAVFVTLITTPRFDDSGLWVCGDACFSRHGGLSETLRFLIDRSPNGHTRSELQEKVRTHVHQHLPLLLRQQAIASFSLGREVVYISSAAERGQQQQTARRPPPVAAVPPALPPALDGLLVLRVLLRLAETPQASIASLAKSLQAQHLPVTAEQVRRIIAFYGVKPNDSLTAALLAQQLRTHYEAELAHLRLPDDLSHRFDPAGPEGGGVHKTTRREVVTRELSRFTAVEVVRQADALPPPPQPSEGVQALVPKGGRYGYDLIAHVGWQTFVRGRTLQDVAEDLQGQQIPFSSLHDVQQKFLFYLGCLHRQRAGLLADYLRQRGPATWLIDSTVEPGTPCFFGILDAEEDLMLGAWKIATESADLLIPCLKQASEWFGRPQRVLHDLSDAMGASCQQALEGVAHGVCHFHLVRDIGIELLDKPQTALRDLVRRLELQSRLKEQRNGQTDWLRQHVEDPTTLARFLRGGEVADSPAVLGRQVLLAFHQWMLDYASDGRRQGYPFDPYLLYFHRRVSRASAAMQRLLSDQAVQRQAPVVLKNFAQMLRDYLGDLRVSAAAQQYEEAFALLRRLRDVLRLSARGDAPLADRYLLAAQDVAVVRELVQELCEECRRASQEATTAEARRANQVVVDHLDRYKQQLFVADGSGRGERTTTPLERKWGGRKQNCRKRHGRKKLTRDFQCLPAEYMLVGNLEQPRYVEVVLGGDIHALAKHFAEVGRTAGPWTKWRKQQQPLNTGRLPQRLLRRENLIETFVSTYTDHCQEPKT